MGVANLKPSGKSSAALGNISLYDCLIVTSATPAMSAISFCDLLSSDACKSMKKFLLIRKVGFLVDIDNIKLFGISLNFSIPEMPYKWQLLRLILGIFQVQCQDQLLFWRCK